MATENKAAKRRKNTGVKVLLCLVILALLLGAGALIASRNYLLLDGATPPSWTCGGMR